MDEYTERIRDIINEHRTQKDLMKDLGLWSQICSSLDVIEDTELAISAYSEGKFRSTEGELYLGIYGLLQSLYLQQDAAFNLCEALAIPTKIDDFPNLKNIRDIRNDSVGHPTKRGTNKSHSYHFISRVTLKVNGFQLLSFDSNQTLRSNNINILDMLEYQKRDISKILESVIRELEMRVMDHKEKFKSKKLETILGTNLEYDLGKIHECAGVALGEETKTNHDLGAGFLSSIKERLKSFQDALSERGLESIDAIVYLYPIIEYPLNELDAYFKGSRDSINDETADIFAYFLSHKILELRDIARSIDEEYDR